MTGADYPQPLRDSLCHRIHAGEAKVDLQAETGISTTTLLKWYRDWCAAHQTKSSLSRIPKNQHNAAAHPPPVSSISIVMAIPDMHHPFCHPDALPFLQAVQARYNPTSFVCLGDEVDAHAFSKYPVNPDGFSPGHELKAAIESLTPFYLHFPKMMVCESNHTVRGHKKAYTAGLPEAFLKHISIILNAPDGWEWRKFWDVDGVRYFHGDAGRSGQYAHLHYLKAIKRSLVIGHIHSYAAVSYEGDNFAVNSGCLIDERAYAFAYASNMPIRPTLGCSIIFNGKWAHFIPMNLDTHGRWTGQL